VVSGLTDMVVPVPTGVVPQPPPYHVHAAPLPKLPPCTVSDVLEPLHTGFVPALILVAGVDG
jgi:hypothetical protein